MLHVALVEDNKEDLGAFTSAFSSFCINENIKYELSTFDNGKDFLSHFSSQFDLIFFDIELGEDNGIDIAKEVRKLDDKVVIVFLTNMAQFAIKGYEVNALDYILKPFSIKLYETKMKRIISTAIKNRKSNIKIVINNGKKIIDSQDLIYIDVYKHYLTYHTTKDTFEVRSSMTEAENLLKDLPFVRANNCYLVNMNYIKGVDKFDLLLTNGETLLISRNRRKDLLDRLARFLGGSL